MPASPVTQLMSKGALPRVLPFALFMCFIGLEELTRYLSRQGVFHLQEKSFLFLYPIKTVAVALTILFFSSKYVEIRWRDLFHLPHTSISIFTGLVVFGLWIHMDWSFAVIGAPAGYNPGTFEDARPAMILTISRLTGAALVVPVMEELFWRSFFVRYVIKPDFIVVTIGQFTWMSFLVTAVLFGLEHNLFLAGIMAGVAYNLLLCYTKSISQCILAHSVTNLVLGFFVVSTGQWQFW